MASESSPKGYTSAVCPFGDHRHDGVVLIGFNPLAGARDPAKQSRVDQLCQCLHDEGLEPHLLSDRDELAAAAAKRHREGRLRAVVAAGGDGTASDLVNRNESNIPVALFPLGTENLLARYLGLSSDPPKAARIIAAGHTKTLDAGLANGRLFLLMASCGFDADVVQRLHSAREGHITQWSYAKPIMRSIRSYQYPQFRVTCRLSGPDAEIPIEYAFPARWAFVSNLPCYAGRLCFSPCAKGDDGRLDVCAFEGRGVWAGLRYLIGVYTQRQTRLSDCIVAQATQIQIDADQPVLYQLDGDPGGCLPLTIEVLPRRMTVIVAPEH
jgi:diacylglycerol kinase family enzyme